MPGTFNSVGSRGWRVYADMRRRITRRGSASPALGSIGNPAREDVEVWNRVTAHRFEQYRAEHQPVRESVAIVCVSCRPQLLEAVAHNVTRQRDVDVQFVFVANHPGFAGLDVAAHFARLDDVTVLSADPAVTLGECLNMAIAATDARFIAKFDDDDIYGEYHLVDSMRAHSYAGAAVVGKHSYYAELASTQRRYLRFGGHDFSYSSTLAGGTLVIDRNLTGDLAFADISLGEDRSFIAACHRRGLSTFSADRFNFLQCRGGDNTWRATDEQFLAGCAEIDEASDIHTVER